MHNSIRPNLVLIRHWRRLCLSAALTCRRVERQSALNHGVGCLLLHRTRTTGQSAHCSSKHTVVYFYSHFSFLQNIIFQQNVSKGEHVCDLFVNCRWICWTVSAVWTWTYFYVSSAWRPVSWWNIYGMPCLAQTTPLVPTSTVRNARVFSNVF